MTPVGEINSIYKFFARSGVCHRFNKIHLTASWNTFEDRFHASHWTGHCLWDPPKLSFFYMSNLQCFLWHDKNFPLGALDDNIMKCFFLVPSLILTFCISSSSSDLMLWGNMIELLEIIQSSSQWLDISQILRPNIQVPVRYSPGNKSFLLLIHLGMSLSSISLHCILV